LANTNAELLAAVTAVEAAVSEVRRMVTSPQWQHRAVTSRKSGADGCGHVAS
jgi:hypothetical protein